MFEKVKCPLRYECKDPINCFKTAVKIEPERIGFYQSVVGVNVIYGHENGQEKAYVPVCEGALDYRNNDAVARLNHANPNLPLGGVAAVVGKRMKELKRVRNEQ